MSCSTQLTRNIHAICFFLAYIGTEKSKTTPTVHDNKFFHTLPLLPAQRLYDHRQIYQRAWSSAGTLLIFRPCWSPHCWETLFLRLRLLLAFNSWGLDEWSPTWLITWICHWLYSNNYPMISYLNTRTKN